MMFRYRVFTIAAMALVTGLTTTAEGQVPNLGGRTGAAASQRTQAQVQQRVQAQVQQRAAANAQSRIHVEAARAAQIAQQAAAIAKRQAEAARRQSQSETRVRAAASVSANGQAEVGNTNAQARTNARLGIEAGLILPPGITQADVQIYDSIFGQFNPLRQQARQTVAGGTRVQSNTAQQPTDSTDNGSAAERRSSDASLLAARGEIDLSSRLVVAMHQRRAQISEMRDHALETGNTQLLLQAERMEESMNAFLAARAATEAEAQSATATRPNVAPPAYQFNGRGNVNANASGAANSRAANAQGSGQASGAGSIQR